MITWSPTVEPFCRYARRRRAARRWMLVDAYRHAADPTSRTLADRLAAPWAGVLAATVREAQAGDDDALAALRSHWETQIDQLQRELAQIQRVFGETN